MSEYASISELRERLAKLPRINSEAFIQACRERGPITPFDLENAVKNKIKEATVYYIYVGAGGRFRFKPYTLKRDEPTLKCAKNWADNHCFDRRFYQDEEEARAMCAFLNGNCPDPEIVRTRIENTVATAMSWGTDNKIGEIDYATTVLREISLIPGLHPDLVRASIYAENFLTSYRAYHEQMKDVAREDEHDV